MITIIQQNHLNQVVNSVPKDSSNSAKILEKSNKLPVNSEPNEANNDFSNPMRGNIFLEDKNQGFNTTEPPKSGNPFEKKQNAEMVQILFRKNEESAETRGNLFGHQNFDKKLGNEKVNSKDNNGLLKQGTLKELEEKTLLIGIVNQWSDEEDHEDQIGLSDCSLELREEAFDDDFMNFSDRNIGIDKVTICYVEYFESD